VYQSETETMSGNSWAGKHKGELLAAAALAAVAVGTGGVGLLGAGAAEAGAGAEGAAAAGGLEAGAGAAAGGLAGADAVGAGAGALGSAGAASAGLGGAAAAGGDGAWLGATEDLAPGGIKGGLINMMGQNAYNNVGTGLDAFGKASKLAQAGQGLLGGQPQPMQPMQRPQGGPMQQTQMPGIPSLAQMYGQPVNPVMDPETLRRWLAMQQQQTGGLG
jgi:hypothetical protein